MPSFVTSSKNTTPAGTNADVVAVTVPSTTALSARLAEIASGADPDTIPSVVSVTASGGTFTLIPGAAVTRVTGSRSARIETWRAPAVAGGITLVTAKTSASGTFGGLIGGDAAGRTLGDVGTPSRSPLP